VGEDLQLFLSFFILSDKIFGGYGIMETLTENLIKERLKKILAKELKIDIEDITDNSHIVDDIGVESADMINLLYDIETEFNIEVSNEEAGKNLTIQKMANLVKEKISIKSAK